MKYFTQDFSQFFKDLAGNNNTEWFHANKQRYEESVKEPFIIFISKMLYEINKLDPKYQITPKECIFRLHRDVRFSQDKSTYKLFSSAAITKNGRKDKSLPGIYIRFSPENIVLMGRCYLPSKEQLHNIRSAISANPKEFRSLIENDDFKNKFGEVKGDVNKRIPKEFQETYKIEPLIANKQFYYGTTFPATMITNKNLVKVIMGHWESMLPLNDFFIQAIKEEKS